MNVLVIGWEAYGMADLVEAMIREGFIVDFFDYPILNQNTRKNPLMGEALVKKMNEKRFEFVFSFNFFTVVSLACNACKIKYVTWIYDSPCEQLYSTVLNFPYNYAFLFDGALYDDLKSKGFETVYYMPLAAPVQRYDKCIPTAEEHRKYDGDVVFVGTTYNEKRDHQICLCLKDFKERTQGYLEGLMQAQRKVYGRIMMEHLLTPEIMKDINRVCQWAEYSDDIQTAEWRLSRVILARKITQMERRDVLCLLADKYQVHMYTNDKTTELGKVIKKDSVHALYEANKVYKCAKINLNITLRSIETGIPLRIMEIMGNGGFLLTNYQEDMLRHFEPGIDFEYYTDYDDLLRKVEYYLENEEERQKIAQNGYEKIKQFHTYKNRLEEMADIILA